MSADKGFLKDLRTIDQTYRVEDDENKKGYYIVKDVDMTLKADGGKSLFIPDPKMLHVRGPCVVLWVPELGGQALDRLREMKMKALEVKIYEDPMNELAFWRAQGVKAKKKKMDLAVDMISEGLMEGYRLARKKSFSYGGSEDKSKEA